MSATVRIAGTGIEIFRLGLGGNVFGGNADRTASEQVLDAFVAAGGNLLDTADQYSFWVPGNSGGESETVIGDWMRRRGNRDAIVVATKVGGQPELKGLAPDTIARAADASLSRLQTDRIDLYYAHFDDEETPLPETLAAFDALVRAGKVRHVGISNYTPERIREWLRVADDHGFARPVALQPAYNLVDRRGYEREIVPLAAEHGLAVFSYFGIAAGFLTGKYRSVADLEGSRRAGRVERYLTPDGLAVLDVLEQVASARGAALATVALAWLLAKPTVTAPLASATSAGQVAELVAAPRVELTAEEVAALDEASQPFA